MAERLMTGYDQSYPPIVSKRSPTNKDRAELGTIWINTTLNDIFILTSVVSGLSTWINCGGGTGTFAALTVDPGDTTITAGNLIVSAGSATISSFGKGLVFSSATGVLSSSAGTNGQIVIGKTGDAPLWGAITCPDGSIGIALGANTIALTATGATASTFPTDAGIATPAAGATTINGDGTNISTAAVADVITITLAPSVSLTGKLTAGNDLEMTTGTCLIASDDNAAQAIYLHANGGVNETIDIYSQLGTTTTSIDIHSAVGGITVAAGTALTLSAASASTLALTNAQLDITTGTGALNIGADATVHTVTLGSSAGASSTVIQAGTGALNITGGGAMTLSTAGLLKIDSSAGRIDIGTDVVAQNINIGTSAAARTISIGNSTGASSVIVDCGTGNFDLGVTTTDHTSRLGSTTGVSALTLQAGTGAMTFTAGGVFDVNATGAVTIDSTGGALQIGNGANAFAVDIGTGAAARTITIGNATGATSIVVNSGTGNLDLGVNATDHTSQLGSTTGVSALTLQAGTGAMTFTAGGVFDVNATGNVTIDSTGGTIGIGEGADANNINIGTGAAARVLTLGNVTGATSVVVDCGTGGASFGASATAHTTTIGSTNTTSTTTVQAGSGGIGLAAAGLVSITAATDTQAGAAVTINANVGKGIFTGLTTAAGATQDFTITNSLVTATSGIIYSIANKGANDAQMQVTRMVPGAGSFVLSVKNQGAAALNGDCIISFIVLG